MAGEISKVEISFTVEGKEKFNNTWSVTNTTVDKVRIVEKILMETMAKIYQALN